jgi:transposase-like protein
MIYYQEIKCPFCETIDLGKAGKSAKGVSRFFCKNEACSKHTFMLKYDNKAGEPKVKEQVLDMAINGSGIRDTSRVLKISKTTVMRLIKKSQKHCSK